MRHNTSASNLNDRALNYGDGCFTTIALLSGKLQLTEQHIQRLTDDCEQLFIPFHNSELIYQQLAQIEDANPRGSSVIKVLISRGEGGRGYSAQGCTEPWFCISQHPFPNHYYEWQEKGVCVGIAQLTLANQPALAGIKHLNRLEQVLVKQELLATECDDLLVLDANENVIEASAANVFWYSEADGWCTSSVAKCGIAGVMRNSILGFMNARGVSIKIGEFPLSSVLSAKSLFMCNSLMTIVPVHTLLVKQKATSYDVRTVAHFREDFMRWLEVQ